jgi:hypothetical protein
MEKEVRNSNRFISLSGLSGIGVGIVGLIGTFFGFQILNKDYNREEKYIKEIISSYDHYSITVHAYLGEKLFFISFFSLFVAIITSFFLTYYRNKKNKQPIWNKQINLEITSLGITLAVALLFNTKLIDNANYGLIIPSSLIMYGTGLLFVSRYSLGQVKYLGIAEVALGLVNLWMTDWGIFFCGIGFGLFHIIYGGITLLVYEKFYIKSIKSDGKW